MNIITCILCRKDHLKLLSAVQVSNSSLLQMAVQIMSDLVRLAIISPHRAIGCTRLAIVINKISQSESFMASPVVLQQVKLLKFASNCYIVQ